MLRGFVLFPQLLDVVVGAASGCGQILAGVGELVLIKRQLGLRQFDASLQIGKAVASRVGRFRR